MNRATESEQRVLAETKYLRLIQQGHWTFAQRPNAIGAVAILAVTDEERILFVEQHRIPVSRPVIELPAGLVGDEPIHDAESLESAAIRELLEETGYEARQILSIVDGVSSAGLTDERVHLMRALDLSRRHAGGGDEHESITVHEIPLADAWNWLSEQHRGGKLIDFKVLAGLYLLSLDTHGS